MSETATDFFLMDERSYVHGTTLLNSMLDLLERETPGSVRLRRIKFQREIRSNGKIVVSSDPKATESFREAPCFMTCDVDGKSWSQVVVEEGKPVQKRVKSSYRIENLQGDGSNGGTCRIAASDRSELIRTLVEANKRFHLANWPAAKGGKPQVRMGYIEDWNIPSADVSLEAELTAKNLISKPTPQGVTTLNRLVYRDANGAETALLICFDVDGGRLS